MKILWTKHEAQVVGRNEDFTYTYYKAQVSWGLKDEKQRALGHSVCYYFQEKKHVYCFGGACGWAVRWQALRDNEGFGASRRPSMIRANTEEEARIKVEKLILKKQKEMLKKWGKA